ncbi:MAG: hypothetical protein IKU26_00220 [Clostridia bacterium]|nr:hypothetical protein [Clostridia bacterium]
MRKCFAFPLILVLALQLFLFLPVSAASGMQATAKAGDPKIDGIARPSEYGEAFVVNGNNTVSWSGWDGLDRPVEYRFAWSDAGLYMAITYDANLIEDFSLLQLNCNPGGQIQGWEQGLFFTVYPDHRVLIHNHRTLAGDASQAPYDLTGQVSIASKVRQGKKTTEVLLPMAAFRITDSLFTFEEGMQMKASAFVMLYYENNYHSGGAISGYLENWTLNEVGLGTLAMAGSSDTPGTGTQMPAFMTKLLLRCVMAAGAILTLGFIAILVVVILFIVGRVRRR